MAITVAVSFNQRDRNFYILRTRHSAGTGFVPNPEDLLRREELDALL